MRIYGSYSNARKVKTRLMYECARRLVCQAVDCLADIARMLKPGSNGMGIAWRKHRSDTKGTTCR